MVFVYLATIQIWLQWKLNYDIQNLEKFGGLSMLRKMILIIALSVFILSTQTVFAKNVYTLREAVNEATSNSYIIKEAIQNEQAAWEKYKSAKANMLPKLSFSYNYTRLKDYPYIISQGIKIKAGHRNNINWNITITQPIFTGFALTTQKEMAKLGFDMSKIQKRQAILDVAENIKIAYFNILLAKKYLKVAKEEVKNLKAHENNSNNFYKTGIIPYNDLLKSKVALSNAIQNEVKAKNNLKLAISSFNLALRRKIDAPTKVKYVLTLRPYNTSLNELIQIAMRKRPVIRVLYKQLRQSYLGVKLAKSAYYPQISIFAQYQQTGKDMLANKNDSSNNHSASVGIQVNWNVFEFGKRYHDVEYQYHKMFALREKINSIKNNIKLDVESAFLDLNSSKQNVKTAKIALKQAKENYKITVERYKQQLATSTDVLDASSYLTQAETNYYSALYGYNIAMAKLKRAVGEK